MGGDQGPRLVVPAVLQALRRFPRLRCQLHGLQQEIAPRLTRAGGSLLSRIDIVHADQQVTMDDKPASAIRKKRNSSLWQALDAVASGSAQGCVSAGNTGALMAMGTILVGTLPGIQRPAICTALPTSSGRAYLLDMGANIQCDADQLLEFAYMATAMVAEVDNLPRPRVALLNLGSEVGKGDATVQAAAARFAADPNLNYCGFVEGDDMFSGAVDIVVCDGFVGNVALKSTEGVARLIATMMRRELSASLRGRLGALVARPALARLQKSLDPANYNGANLLGLKATVIKSHGGASEAGFVNALAVAVREVEKDIPARISSKLAQLHRGSTTTSH